MKIGFVGYGAMGKPMVHRLLAAGADLTMWGRTPAKLADAEAAGAKIVGSAKAVAEACDVILFCVLDDAAVEDLVFKPDGLAAGGASGKVVVDHSTIHPRATQEFAQRLENISGMGWVDAPVSGGSVGARAGTLAVMVGGEKADLEIAHPAIECYAANITWMGLSGSGQATKAINQMIIGAEVAVMAEALAFAKKFGVQAPSIPDCLKGGWADSPVLQDHARRMAAAQYDKAGNARIMTKDVGIAVDLGRDTGSPMPVSELVLSLYRDLIDQGHENCGQIGLMRLYADGPL